MKPERHKKRSALFSPGMRTSKLVSSPVARLADAGYMRPDTPMPKKNLGPDDGLHRCSAFAVSSGY